MVALSNDLDDAMMKCDIGRFYRHLKELGRGLSKNRIEGLPEQPIYSYAVFTVFSLLFF